MDGITTKSERLEFWKQIAQIASAVALPVVIALIGYFVQRSLSESSLKKDYVQMAISLLKDEPSEENEQLRQWAISVLDKNSPVPLPASLKYQLVTTTPMTFAWDSPDIITDCKPVPNPETLEWLLNSDPLKYIRGCPAGQVGVRMYTSQKYFSEVRPRMMREMWERSGRAALKAATAASAALAASAAAAELDSPEFASTHRPKMAAGMYARLRREAAAKAASAASAAAEAKLHPPPLNSIPWRPEAAAKAAPAASAAALGPPAFAIPQRPTSR